MALEVTSLLTNTAKQRMALQGITGKAYKVVSFSLNNAGHDPSNTTIALPPNPNDVVCPGGIPLFSNVITSSSIISSYCPLYTCTLGPTEGVGFISNICLIAEIISSPIENDPEVGTTFLYSIGTFPLRPKLFNEVLILNVSVQN